MKPILPFLFSSLLFLSGCSLFFDREPREIPERELPDITAEGAHTFGCKIDGEVYIPFTCSLFSPRLSSAYGYSSNYFDLFASQFPCDSSAVKILAIYLQDFTLTDTMWLGTRYGRNPISPSRYASFAESNQTEDYRTWTEDSVNFSGWVHIHAANLEIGDSLRFVAGTFEFTARDTAINQQIKVTEGRFDVALNR